MKTDYPHGEMGLESCVYYSARRYVISRLSSSFNELSIQMTASLGFFVGNRRSSMPYRTREIKIRCLNEVLLRCHRISVRWAPVISSLCVPRRIIHLPYVRHEQTKKKLCPGLNYLRGGKFGVLGTIAVVILRHTTPSQPVHLACSCSSQSLLVYQVVQPDTRPISSSAPSFLAVGSQSLNSLTSPRDEIRV
jgi:hypothetical protein